MPVVIGCRKDGHERRLGLLIERGHGTVERVYPVPLRVAFVPLVLIRFPVARIQPGCRLDPRRAAQVLLDHPPLDPL